LGSPAREVLHKIGKALLERKVILAVCLDDANYLLPDKVLNSVLYLLLRIHETYPGTKAGIMATVSNMEMEFARELDPCVMSVFHPMEIYFSPYTWEEVHGILQDRIRQALFPGAIPDEIVNDIVDKAMACGDLRVGLDLVRRASLNAEREGLMAVCGHHVESAFEFSKNVHLESTMKTLNKEELNLLTHIAHLTLEDPDSPLTAGMLYDSAQRRMRISYTNFHQRIKKLSMAE
jgi:cell division control protein 6